ncbi:uncharacterized protein [Oscarella lobularis]
MALDGSESPGETVAPRNAKRLRSTDEASPRERALFVVLVLLLWSVIALPTVFYALPNTIDALENVTTNDELYLKLLGISVFTNEVKRLQHLIPIPDLIATTNGNISCPLHFIPIIIPNATTNCVPDCRHFSIYEGVLHGTENALLALGFGVSIVCLFIIVTSWINVRNVRSFPQIIPFYIATSASLSVFVSSVFYVLGRHSVFCPSPNLVVSINMTSISSNAQGSLVHFFSEAASLWWLFCAINLYITICWPLSSAAHYLTSASPHRIHLIELLCSLLIPLGLVVVVHSIDDGGYFATLGPDTVGCTPRSRALTYFSIILPLQLFLGTGLTLILAVIFRLNRERRMSSSWRLSFSRTNRTLQQIERRFIFLFVSYPICIAVILSTIIVQLRDVDNFENSFRLFLICLRFGIDTPTCQTFLSSTQIAASIASQVAFIFYAICGLAVVMVAKPVRTFWTQLFLRIAACCCHRRYDVTDGESRKRRTTNHSIVRYNSEEEVIEDKVAVHNENGTVLSEGKSGNNNTAITTARPYVIHETNV